MTTIAAICFFVSGYLMGLLTLAVLMRWGFKNKRFKRLSD